MISVQVVSAVPSPGPVGRPVTLASVPGAPFVFSGRKCTPHRRWYRARRCRREGLGSGDGGDRGVGPPGRGLRLGDVGSGAHPAGPRGSRWYRVVRSSSIQRPGRKMRRSRSQPSCSVRPGRRRPARRRSRSHEDRGSQESADAGAEGWLRPRHPPAPDDVADMGREKVLPLLVQAVQSAV